MAPRLGLTDRSRPTPRLEDFHQPAVGGLCADHQLRRHPQLQLGPLSSGPRAGTANRTSESDSTIVRRSAGESMAEVFEARNLFITSLPEVLLLHMHKCTAKQVYQEWQQCEVIIGKRPRRGHA